MLDLELLVLAEAGQALRIERALDLACPFLAVVGCDGTIEVAVPHQLDMDIGVPASLHDRDVDMLNMLSYVDDDLRQLRLAVGPAAVGEYTHRHGVFPDAVDAACQMVLGAESGLQKPIDDLGVGEIRLFRALTRDDGGDFSRRRRRPGGGTNDRGQAGCDEP